MSGIEVIRCEIALKALYFPSKLHKKITSKVVYKVVPATGIIGGGAAVGAASSTRSTVT